MKSNLLLINWNALRTNINPISSYLINEIQYFTTPLSFNILSDQPISISALLINTHDIKYSRILKTRKLCAY